MQFFFVKTFGIVFGIEASSNAGKFSPNAGKSGPGKTPHLDTFHAVIVFQPSCSCVRKKNRGREQQLQIGMNKTELVDYDISRINAVKFSVTAT